MSEKTAFSPRLNAGALKKAHCDAALEPMVSVEKAGKLFERDKGGRMAG